LNKQEALDVIHEIHDAIAEYVTVTSVSSDPEQLYRLGTGYVIRLECDLDYGSRCCIENVLVKHQLTFREGKGYVLILRLH
jgi:hypothetical protein